MNKTSLTMFDRLNSSQRGGCCLVRVPLISVGIVLACLVALVLPSSYALASDGVVKERFNLQSDFTKPEEFKVPPPVYLKSKPGRNATGYVEVSLMVDAQGRVFESVIERSSHRSLESGVRAAVNVYRFEPARLAEKAIMGRAKVVFKILPNQYDDSDLTPHITRIEKRERTMLTQFMARLNDDNENDLENEIAVALKKQRLSYCGRANTLYVQQQLAAKHGNTALEIDALRALKDYGEVSRKLGDEIINRDDQKRQEMCFDQATDVLFYQRLIGLLIDAKMFGAAYREVQKIDSAVQPTLDDELVTLIIQKAEESAETGPNSKEYRIPKRGYELVELFSMRVEISAKEGELSAVKLRCDTGFIQEPIESSIVIDIPKGFGQCQAEIRGKSGVEFQLNQI